MSLNTAEFGAERAVRQAPRKDVQYLPSMNPLDLLRGRGDRWTTAVLMGADRLLGCQELAAFLTKDAAGKAIR